MEALDLDWTPLYSIFTTTIGVILPIILVPGSTSSVEKSWHKITIQKQTYL